MPRKPPRLTLRIACYTAAALLFAAGALLWFVDQRATAQAESQAAGRAHFIADILLRDRLTRADFARPVTERRRSRLDVLFVESAADPGDQAREPDRAERADHLLDRPRPHRRAA